MKTALVTGAAGGIGLATVKQLCADGFAVAICYFSSEEKAKALSSELLRSGAEVITVYGDVSLSADAARIVSEVNERFGSIDVLVNNAGIAQQKLFDTITDDDWFRMINVNLTGVFNMCRAVLPLMLKRKYGRIINISSMWGESGGACEVHYSAAKAGVIGLTKALAKEVAPSAITVNSVSPGAVDTDMLSCFSAADKKLITEDIPVGRLGKPEDIARAVSFLSSEKASYITGQVISVNGGSVI